MTVKKTLVVNTNEIKTIDIRCGCGCVLTMPIATQKLSRNLNCASCGEALWMDGAHIQQAVFLLFQSIRGINENGKRLSVAFTIDE